jgi:MoxR-like ATPase
MSVPEPIYEAVAQLVRATRPGDSNCPQDYQSLIKYGSGPRGGISLCEAAKGFAVLEGEAVVRWRHIRKAAIPVLRHRVRLLPQARIKGLDADGLIAAITDVIEKKASKLD